MVFSSTVFLFIFLPWTLIVHYFLSPRYRNFFLLVMSLIFYAWGEGALTFLIMGSIGVNYLGGLLIGHFKINRPALAKGTLAGFIALNVMVLIYYKYFNFILSSFQEIHLFTSSVVTPRHLPIGISFYTFHIMSYLIDVYRRDAIPQRNPFNLGLYIFLFPQLVAGPIIRYKDISQKIASRFITGVDFTNGLIRFIRGLSKKMILANTLAVVADRAFLESPDHLPAAMAWLGIIAYTLQIYFDFSGYSDMAIGLGKMLGFNFPENFNYPYISVSIKEFWQRWHISLSTWFRDYLYIPLGGNKKGRVKTYRNLFIVFFITGLWHGASWNFVVWGLFHGCFLVLERSRFSDVLLKLPKFLRHVYVLVVVITAWVFFRADNLGRALDYLRAMWGGNTSHDYTVFLSLNNYTLLVFAGAILFSTNLRPTVEKSILRDLLRPEKPVYAYLMARYVVYLGLFFYSCVELARHSYNPFIYFRF